MVGLTSCTICGCEAQSWVGIFNVATATSWNSSPTPLRVCINIGMPQYTTKTILQE